MAAFVVPGLAFAFAARAADAPAVAVPSPDIGGQLWIPASISPNGTWIDDAAFLPSLQRSAAVGQFIYGRPGRLVANGMSGLDCSEPRKGSIWIIPGTTYDGSYVVDRLGCDEVMTDIGGGLFLGRGPRNVAAETPNLRIDETFDATTANGIAFSPGGPGGVASTLQVNSFVPTPAHPADGTPARWTQPFVWGLVSSVHDGGRAAPDGIGGAQHVALAGQLEREPRAKDDRRLGDIGFGLYGHVGSPNDVPTTIDGSLVGAEIDVAAHNLDPGGARAELALNCATEGPGSGAQCGHGLLFGDAPDQGAGRAAFNTSLIDAIGASYLVAGIDLTGMQPVHASVTTSDRQPAPDVLRADRPLSRVAPGELVAGPGIRPGTRIRSVDPASGEIMLDRPAAVPPGSKIGLSSDGPAIRVGDGRGIQMDTAGVFRIVYVPDRRWVAITVNGATSFAVDEKGRVHVHGPPIADLP